jgi:hypothetical protein
MRDALDDLLRRRTLLTIAAAIALGYALLDVAQGAAGLVLSVFTQQATQFDAGRSPLSLRIGGRVLEFAQLVAGVVTLAVVLAAILYVLRRERKDAIR